MRRLINNARETIILMILIVIGLLILIWNKELNVLKTEKENAIAYAVQRNSNLVLALENYTTRTIQNADLILEVVKRDLKNNDFHGFDDLLLSLPTDQLLINSLAITDSSGNIISSANNVQAGRKINVADREYFQFHRFRSEDMVFISKPVVSKITGNVVITLSRRINSNQGKFSGIVFLQIIPSVFTSFYEGAVVNKHDIVSLIAPDGTTYARQTGPVSSYGENISKSPLFIHVAKDPIGSYFAKDAIRNIATYFSYRKIVNYPIIATVGLTETDVLENYRKTEKREWLFTIGISLLLIVFTGLACAGILQRRKNIRALEESEEKYRLMFQNGGDAIVLISPEGEILAQNPSAYRVFNVKPDSKEILRIQEFSDIAEYLDAPGDDIFGENNIYNGEVNFRRRGGAGFIGDVAAATYRDAKNKKVIVAVIRDTTERKRLENELATERNQRQQLITKQVIQAQERERAIIGGELHDNVCQILSTAKLYLSMAGKNGEPESLLAKSGDLIHTSIQEIRNLSHKLTAPSLGKKSLVDSVSELLEDLRSATGLKVNFVRDEKADEAGPDQKLAIFRIVQEQLNNIVKHAGATVVDVSLKKNNESIELIIKDNGRGFATDTDKKGIGLNNMEGRVKAFSGRLNIISSEGNGCTVEAVFPVNNNVSKVY
jgi:PAS domain S-box-containing protein